MSISRRFIPVLLSMILCFSGLTTLAIEQTSITAEIKTTGVVLSNSAYKTTINLVGEERQGDRIVAEHFDENSNLKKRTLYEFSFSVDMVFNDAKPSDYVRILWIDAKQNQRCEPALLLFNVVHVLDWADLAMIHSFMIQEYEGEIELVSNDFNYASGRLIAKVHGELPDISLYHPVLTVVDDEGYYYIQFLRDIEAKECLEFLVTFNNVIYVEPDVAVYATDDIN